MHVLGRLILETGCLAELYSGFVLARRGFRQALGAATEADGVRHDRVGHQPNVASVSELGEEGQSLDQYRLHRACRDVFHDQRGVGGQKSVAQTLHVRGSRYREC